MTRNSTIQEPFEVKVGPLLIYVGITEGARIPDGSLVLGSPGKVIREITGKEIKMIKDGAEHYVKNIKKYKRNKF